MKGEGGRLALSLSKGGKCSLLIVNCQLLIVKGGRGWGRLNNITLARTNFFSTEFAREPYFFVK